MFEPKEEDLKRCLEMLTIDWNRQNNFQDRQTNFIYKANTLDECLNLIQLNRVDEQYALHRWYNYMTSIKCEYIFCEFGAIHEDDIYKHDVDIYIRDIPFDVKLTIYPAKLGDRPYDLRTRQGKNSMIDWYYMNQSQQGRKQLVNRLYVVCDGATPYECLKMKSDFNILRQRIKAYMENVSEQGLNSVTVIDNGKQYTLYSDIVYIRY